MVELVLQGGPSSRGCRSRALSLTWATPSKRSIVHDIVGLLLNAPFFIITNVFRRSSLIKEGQSEARGFNIHTVMFSGSPGA